MSESTQLSKPRRRDWRIGRWALIAVATLIVAEMGLRGFVYYLREPFERFDRDAGTFVLVPGDHEGGFGGRVLVNESGFTGAPLRERIEGGRRLVAAGDSCTFGGGDGVHTYPDLLAERLAARPGSAGRYAVVNAGISGLDTRQVTRRLRSQVVRLEPDVVVVYVGWNDLMKKSPAGQAGTTFAADAQAWLDELWLVRGARKVVFQQLRPALADPKTGPESRTGRFRYFDPGRFRRDLDELVTAVQDTGAEPLLVTLPSPLRENLTPEQLGAMRITFPSVGGTYGVGDFVDLLAAYNGAIQRVAGERDVPLLDLAERFDEVPDPARYFHDTMHPNDRGMDVIARLLEASLVKHGLLAERADRPRQQPADG